MDISFYRRQDTWPAAQPKCQNIKGIGSILSCLIIEMSAVYAHSVEILMTNVTSVIVLGTWLEIVPVIAVMLEQHHPVAGNLHLFNQSIDHLFENTGSKR